MASATTIANFIAEVAPCAQKAYKVFGKVKPSICIAMACVESAYGTSKIMRQHNAFMGFKVGSGRTAVKYWDGSFFVAKTKEEYKVGQHTIIKDAFRSYPVGGMQQCILNFYELLNTNLYSKVKADADVVTQMNQIKACGYMTSSTEVNTVLSLISRYNLTKYDGICVPTPSIPVNPYKLTATLVKRGMKGESVKWVQWELNRHGANLVVDGVFGLKTLEAVILFQQTHPPLKVDGLVGQKTIAELKK